MICEALYYGKPVLCFPIGKLFEQYLNSYYIRELGYGDFSTDTDPDPEIFSRFEAKVERYRQAVLARNFDGTQQVVERLKQIIGEYISATKKV